jgi:hypothetical protein
MYFDNGVINEIVLLPLSVRATRGMNSVQESDGYCLVFIISWLRFCDFVIQIANKNFWNNM